MQPLYAIIDLETTGGRAARDRITEVAIVLHDGEKVIRQWESLINPECYIPQGISELTGITQEMVRDAPKFYEAAKEIVEMTQDAIFVAHNVRFDYAFLCEEFKRLGFTYSRKQLCTLRLSRQAFPGLPSYSLGKLADSLGVPLVHRHRAMGDARATAEIFRLILQKHQLREEAAQIINMGIRESSLPLGISLEKIHSLPESCGVYYLHDTHGHVVYVGKSINIRKRVAEHFADNSTKAARLRGMVNDISFEVTGSELVALLLESHEIKRLNPPVNRAQRARSYPYAVYTYSNPEGYLCFAMDKVSAKAKQSLQVVAEYAQLAHARGHLQSIREQFELCANLCDTPKQKGPCFFFHLHQCHGACKGLESPETYNHRALQAMEKMGTLFDRDFFLLDEGRNPQEKSVIFVGNGMYQGFGYLDITDLNGNPEILGDAVKKFPGNPETNRIIHRHMQQNPTLKIVNT